MHTLTDRRRPLVELDGLVGTPENRAQTPEVVADRTRRRHARVCHLVRPGEQSLGDGGRALVVACPYRCLGVDGESQGKRARKGEVLDPGGQAPEHLPAAGQIVGLGICQSPDHHQGLVVRSVGQRRVDIGTELAEVAALPCRADPDSLVEGVRVALPALSCELTDLGGQPLGLGRIAGQERSHRGDVRRPPDQQWLAHLRRPGGRLDKLQASLALRSSTAERIYAPKLRPVQLDRISEALGRTKGRLCLVEQLRQGVGGLDRREHPVRDRHREPIVAEDGTEVFRLACKGATPVDVGVVLQLRAQSGEHESPIRAVRGASAESRLEQSDELGVDGASDARKAAAVGEGGSDEPAPVVELDGEAGGSPEGRAVLAVSGLLLGDAEGDEEVGFPYRVSIG